MNKSVIFYNFLLLIFSGFILADDPKRYIDPYVPGESIEYRVHYGFINAGEARVDVDHKYYRVNDKICYKASVYGKTTGAFEMALRIKDTWGTYVDTLAMRPQKAFRNIEEGKYRLFEDAQFEYKQGLLVVERQGRDKKAPKNIKEYKVPLDVQDIVSGYFFLRSIDFARKRIGDTIKVNAFFEDKVYDFRIKYLGKQILDCKFGNIKSIKLSPIMPDNQLFDGENSIRLWLSDDGNRIPLKIQANLFLGDVEMDIKGYKGLRHPIYFTKD